MLKNVEVDGVTYVPIQELSAALDEIWALRKAMAYEARTSEAHGEYRTFPKSRRGFLDEQVERMRAAARGEVAAVYANASISSFRAALLEAGAQDTLVRAQWLAEKGLD